MRKILFVLALLCLLASATWATDVTVQSVQVRNWIGPRTDIQLWLFLTEPMVTLEGESFVGSSPTKAIAVVKVACTVSETTQFGVKSYILTIPTFTLTATRNAARGRTAQYQAVFYQVPANKAALKLAAYQGFEQFFVEPQPMTQTWAQIALYNKPPIAPPVDYGTFTRSEVLGLINPLTPPPLCTAGQLLYYALTGKTQTCLNVGTGLVLNGGTLSAAIDSAPNFASTGDNLTTTDLTKRPRIEVSQGLQVADDATAQNTVLRTQSAPTGFTNVVTDLGANPDNRATTGTIAAGSTQLTVMNLYGFRKGTWVAVELVGSGGSTHIAQIADVDRAAKRLTLSVAAVGAGTNVAVYADNTEPFQAALNLTNTSITVPYGYYRFNGHKPLQFRNHLEGNPTIMKGAGDAATNLFWYGTGDMFVGLSIDACKALYGNSSPTCSALPHNSIENFEMSGMSLIYAGAQPSRGWAIDLAPAGVVNYPKFSHLRVYGFRGGLYCSNCQGARLDNNVFRRNKLAHLVLASDEQTFVSAKEPNVASIINNQFDLINGPEEDDRVVSGLNYAAQSHLLTSGAAVFVSDDEGRIIKLNGADTVGGYMLGTILKVVSATQAVVSFKNARTVGGAGDLTNLTATIYKSSWAGIFLHRSSGTKLDGNIVQGNFSGSMKDGTGLRIWNSTNVRVVNHWSEDAGGRYGASIEAKDTDGLLIDGWRSNASDGVCQSGGAHCFNYIGSNAKRTQVLRYGGGVSTPEFILDANSDISADYGAGESVHHPTSDERVIIGDHQRGGLYIGAEYNAGLDTFYDGTYGEQWMLNPRMESNANWTISNPAVISFTNTGTGRHKSYATINTQSLANGSSTVRMAQVVNVPDGLEAGNAVFAFDYKINNLGTGTAVPGQIFEIQICPSAGGVGYNCPVSFKWQIDHDNARQFPVGRWQRAQFNLKFGAGAARTFTVNIMAGAGAATPNVSVTNFRMHSGRHAAFSDDQPITELKGGAIASGAQLQLLAGAGSGSRVMTIDNSGTVGFQSWPSFTPGGGTSTAQSVQGDGTLGNPVKLVNDSATPGNNKVYGTDASGVKGWKNDPVSGITSLSGDVIATGTGAATATIQPGAVTFSKLQAVNAAKLLGNPTGSSATTSEIGIGAGLAFVGNTLTATNSSALTGLTGAVTSVGVGGVVSTVLQPGVVTFNNFQNINTQKLLGRSDAGLGAPQEISIGAGLALSGGVLSATGSGTGGGSGGSVNGVITENRVAKGGATAGTVVDSSISDTGSLINLSSPYVFAGGMLEARTGLIVGGDNTAANTQTILEVKTGRASQSADLFVAKNAGLNPVFRVKPNGNVSIKQVDYNWPTQNILGFLFNDGAGNLNFQQPTVADLFVPSPSVLIGNSALTGGTAEEISIGTGLTLAGGTLSATPYELDTTSSYIWDGNHTFNQQVLVKASSISGQPQNRLVLDGASTTANNQSYDSAALLIQGNTRDSSGVTHTTGWRLFNDNATNDGTSYTLRLANRLDSTAFVDRLTITENGNVTIGSLSGSSTRAVAASSSGGLTAFDSVQIGSGGLTVTGPTANSSGLLFPNLTSLSPASGSSAYLAVDAFGNVIRGATISALQNITGPVLLGRYSAGAGASETITLGSNLSFSGNVLNATGGANPAGTGTELQYRNGAALGAVTGSSVSGGSLSLTASSATPTLTLNNAYNADVISINKGGGTGSIGTGVLTSSQASGWNISLTDASTYLYNASPFIYKGAITSAVDAFSLQGGNFTSTVSRTTVGSNSTKAYGIVSEASNAQTALTEGGYGGYFRGLTANVSAIYGSTTTSATVPVLVTQTGSSATGNHYEARNSGGTVQFSISTAGVITAAGLASSGTRISSASSAGVLGTFTPTNNSILIGDGTSVAASVVPDCSNGTTGKLLYNATTRAFSCGADQTGAGGSGITSLGGQTGSTQSFSNDTNITISSAANVHTLGWSGTLAKARQNSATAYTDAANTWSTGAQDFGAATSLKVPTGAGAAPTASGLLAYDSTSNTLEAGVNGANKTVLFTDGSGASLTGITFAQITSKPTTLSGYGITDAISTTTLPLSIISPGVNQFLGWTGSAWSNLILPDPEFDFLTNPTASKVFTLGVNNLTWNSTSGYWRFNTSSTTTTSDFFKISNTGNSGTNTGYLLNVDGTGGASGYKPIRIGAKNSTVLDSNSSGALTAYQPFTVVGNIYGKSNGSAPAIVASVNEYNTSIGVTPRGLVAYEYDTGGFAHSAHITGAKARGTAASPSTILSGDYIAGFTAELWDGTGWKRGGYLAFTNQTISGSSFDNSAELKIAKAGSEVLTASFTNASTILTNDNAKLTLGASVSLETAGVERINVSSAGLTKFAKPVAIGATAAADIPLLVDTSVGTNVAPYPSLIISGSNNTERLETRSYGGASVSPGFQGRNIGGTVGSPTATPSGAFLVFFGGTGHDGTALVPGNRALLAAKAEETWTTTAQGAYFGIETTAPGGVSRTEKLRVRGNGDVYLPTSSGSIGLIMKSPDGTCYRLTIANGGTVTTASTTCP